MDLLCEKIVVTRDFNKVSRVCGLITQIPDAGDTVGVLHAKVVKVLVCSFALVVVESDATSIDQLRSQRLYLPGR